MNLTVDGHEVFAATGGRPFDPALPALVLLHGSGMDHTVWQLQARYFAHHGRSVLAVDLPAHGRSQGAPLASIEEMGAWVWRVLDAAGAERAALVGHSMGAFVALAAAAAAPERTEALALLGIAERIPVHPDLLAAAKANEHLAYELIISWGFGRAGHIGGHQAPGLWMMGGGMRLYERNRPGVLAAALAACDAYEGAPAAAARIGCPALVAIGTDDLMTPPKSGRALAAKMAKARVVTFERCGHMMTIEDPDATLDALRGFL